MSKYNTVAWWKENVKKGDWIKYKVRDGEERIHVFDGIQHYQAFPGTIFVEYTLGNSLISLDIRDVLKVIEVRPKIEKEPDAERRTE